MLAGQLLTYSLSVANAGPSERHRRERHRHAAGRRDLRAPPRPRRAPAPSRAARSPARWARSRTVRRERLDQGHAAVRGLDHQPGERLRGHRRPGTGQQLGERHDDRQSGRRPLDHQVRLARPGARRAAAHVQLSVANAGPSERHRRVRHRHAPGRRDVRLRHALAGHLLRVERHGHLRAGHDRERPSASVEIKVAPAAPRARSPTRQRVSATTADPVLVNNSASATTTVDPAADLSLAKSDSPDPVLAGAAAHLHAHRQQRRPVERDRRAASTDTLPAGVTFVSATPSQGTCSQSSGTVTCALGHDRERPGRHRRDQGPPAAPGTITNQATVSPRRADPDFANNSASADDDRRPGRRPLAHEVRLARPGARRAAAHLHAERRQRRALRAHRRAASPTRCRRA